MRLPARAVHQRPWIPQITMAGSLSRLTEAPSYGSTKRLTIGSAQESQACYLLLHEASEIMILAIQHDYGGRLEKRKKVGGGQA